MKELENVEALSLVLLSPADIAGAIFYATSEWWRFGSVGKLHVLRLHGHLLP